jgi:imidazolonepropionase-like amidohydrolase
VTAPVTADPRGCVLRGRVWLGAASAGWDDGAVVLDASGVIVRIGPAADVDLPTDVPVLGGPACWVGPGVVDAHVHLAFGRPEDALAAGVVAVRDLGAPLAQALAWRTDPEGRPPLGRPWVTVAGPLLTAPGGYPSRSWGADGFARFVHDPAAATRAVDELVEAGVDVVKVALEPAGGAPVLDPATLRSVTEGAHAHGRRVTTHALAVAMVERALHAGVDELCHTPTERLPDSIVERLAAADVPVVSTLAALCRTEDRDVILDNATRLVAAGVPLVYGTDLGNAGTRPGVDPEELALLAATGLGAQRALEAATAAAADLVTEHAGPLTVGQRLTGVVLPSDPLIDTTVWRRPLATFVDGCLSVGQR